MGTLQSLSIGKKAYLPWLPSFRYGVLVWKHLLELTALFTSIDFQHVYREHNEREDILYKDALHLTPGLLSFKEFYEGIVIGETSIQLFWKALALIFLLHYLWVLWVWYWYSLFWGIFDASDYTLCVWISHFSEPSLDKIYGLSLSSLWTVLDSQPSSRTDQMKEWLLFCLR